MTTPKKPSEWLRELLARVEGTQTWCESPKCKAGTMMSLEWMRQANDLIAAAERAEAQAEGESVEGLMRECAEASGEMIRLTHGSYGGVESWLAAVATLDGPAAHTCDIRPVVALRNLRDRITPPTPDASWLDSATFEEMERWLPKGSDLVAVGAASAGHHVADYRGARMGPDCPTRTEAVRAFLRAHPECWEGRR